MLLDIIILLIGFVIIIKSSDVLVDAASSLALKLRVPKMLIALTIVSFGTCAPEVAISFRSVANGDGVMAFANVVGSSIVNVFLIIGLASFLRPIKVRHATVKKELPLLFIVTTAFSFLMLDAVFNPITSNTFSRNDSFILIDIGGQDSKVILGKDGYIEDFIMNDKCAASTGRFIENACNVLGISIDELFEEFERRHK